jgi:hypothetical protein
MRPDTAYLRVSVLFAGGSRVLLIGVKFIAWLKSLDTPSRSRNRLIVERNRNQTAWVHALPDEFL